MDSNIIILAVLSPFIGLFSLWFALSTTYNIMIAWEKINKWFRK